MRKLAIYEAAAEWDDEQELAIRYGVMSIPTVIFFRDGKEIDRKVGVRPTQVFPQVRDENA